MKRITLTINEAVINNAKLYCNKKGISLSFLIESYLKKIEAAFDDNLKLKAFEKHIKIVKSTKPTSDLSKAKMKKIIHSRRIQKHITNCTAN
jgi:hypothetical protein